MKYRRPIGLAAILLGALGFWIRTASVLEATKLSRRNSAFACLQDYLGFVRNYSEYVLVRNVMLWLLPANEVKSCITDYRREDEWEEDAPHSIFPFAEVAYSGGLLFAFRQLSPRVMDVVFFDPSATSEFEVMGPRADRFTSDASFTEWLLRMVETEGLPFRPGGEIDSEIYTVTRVSNE